ncbi:hypothetical protein SUVC_03G0650 [Saccharomyces uvarum]|uniref:Uncharacterized protein n=1 Tax=Saccharomyces uvarum TaxID=230603 RepID=A0AA35JF18_SACUV|nr:hypothetical protein SUVC_03G0650 [Saccharomyces uvarum]
MQERCMQHDLPQTAMVDSSMTVFGVVEQKYPLLLLLGHSVATGRCSKRAQTQYRACLAAFIRRSSPKGGLVTYCSLLPQKKCDLFRSWASIRASAIRGTAEKQ